MVTPRVALFALLGAALLPSPSGRPRTMLAARQTPPSRIVAIGDIHGAADQFVAILQAAGLTDAAGQWTGGTATLVQTGDYLDRGGAARRAIDLLMALDDQARAAGGRAEILIGNHEVMNMLHEFTDVSPEAFASFADGKSEDRRRKAYDDGQAAAKRSGTSFPSKDEWMASHPAGYVEYVDAMGPRGRYGKWLRGRKAVVQIDGTVFMHAGIAPDSPDGVDDVNRAVARAIKAWDDAADGMVQERVMTPYATLKEIVAAAVADLQRISAALDAGRPLDPRVTREYVDQLKAAVEVGKGPLLAAAGPMWFRGLSETPTEETSGQVTALLSRLGATRIVIAHTPRLPGLIAPRFDNRVFPIDTGMLSSFFKGGRASALEIAGSRVTAIYVGERNVLVEK